MARPNQARLDLAALRHNLGVARGLAPQSKVMAVVKANAYGHGAVTISRQLQSLADALAVASIEEAVELRDAGITAPILLLEGVFEARELGIAAQLGFWVTIDNEWQMRWLEEAVLPEPVHCWLKVDTGMHRLGVPAARTDEFYARIKASGNTGDNPVIYTHFASAGLLAWPDARYDWVRPGYMLYGNSPMAAPHPNAEDLQPVMTLTSAVISVREIAAGEAVGYGANWIAARPSRIATVTIGYGDGYPRVAANGTPVLVNGHRAGLAGRVSMDMITVDVTELPEVQVGDEVVLWGKGLPLAEVASHAGTIGYELTTRMPARTPRVVIND
jgi:alanine racemase